MSALAKGFDRLAPIYDLLARIVIGKGIRTSQLHFLTHLQEKRALLILGGGTGWILPFIFKLNPTLHIDYIELSKKMIGKAKRNARADQRIRFIEGTETTISGKYDCVITNFYLDLFTSDELYGVVRKIKSNLHPNSCWVATDFVSDRKWHGLMLWIMYGFFKMTTGLKTLSLPHWEESIKQAGGKLVKTNVSSWGFIKSAVFQF